MWAIIIYYPHNKPLKQILFSSHYQEGSGHTEASNMDKTSLPDHSLFWFHLSGRLSKEKIPLGVWSGQARGPGFQVKQEAASGLVSDSPILNWSQRVSETQCPALSSILPPPNTGAFICSASGSECGSPSLALKQVRAYFKLQQITLIELSLDIWTHRAGFFSSLLIKKDPQQTRWVLVPPQHPPPHSSGSPNKSFNSEEITLLEAGILFGCLCGPELPLWAEIWVRSYPRRLQNWSLGVQARLVLGLVFSSRTSYYCSLPCVSWPPSWVPPPHTSPKIKNLYLLLSST